MPASPDRNGRLFPVASEPMVTGFRELPSVSFWGASVTVPMTEKSSLLDALEQTSRSTKFTFTGCLTSDREQLTYHFSRYPRHKRGIPTTRECEEALTTLIQNGGPTVTQVESTNTSQEFRVLLGLREGYEEESKTHSVEEIKEHFGEDVTVMPADIYVVGPTRKYEEPAVLLTGPKRFLSRVYQLAEHHHQERFTVEDLQTGVAYVVETPSCPTPDPTI